MTIVINKVSKRNLILMLAIFFTIVGKIGSNIFLFFAIVLYSYAMLKGTDLENFEIGLLLIPCIRLFDSIGITNAVNILLFFPIVVSVARRGKIDRHAFFHTLILCIIEAFHCLTLNNIDNLLSNLSAISTLYFCEILIKKNVDYDPIHIFRWLSYGVVLSAVTYLIVASSRSRDILYFITRGVRFEAFANDPNYYSMYICIAISCFFISRSTKWYDIITVIVDFLFGLITSSKMSLIVIIFIVTANGFRQLSSVNRKRRKVYRWTVVIAGIITILNVDRVMRIFANVIARTTNSKAIYNLSILTTGRSTLVMGYINQLLSNPIALFWGYGFQYVKHIGVAMNKYMANNVSHNTFLDVFLSWGLIGVITITWIFIQIIRKSFDKNSHYSFYDKIPILCLLFSLCALSCLSAGMFWYVVAATMLAVKNSRNKKMETASVVITIT